MLPAPDEISYRTPQRIVPDEYEPLDALPELAERVVPDFVTNHVQQYALRLQLARSRQSDG
jgi:hypothetical protein